jgi:hypothetical protein
MAMENPYLSSVATDGPRSRITTVIKWTICIFFAATVVGAVVGLYAYDKGWNDCLKASGYSLDPNRAWVIP